ncbi:MAG: hypothetical protein QOH61_2471 [Chloroflexota bacterium]|jgi:RHS repeat-associated protein|nr:hypothetical protein [Chloroflexota bacterium]
MRLRSSGGDTQGSVLASIDSAGTLSGLTHLDPYGNPLQGNSATPGIGYTGEWSDASGLINLRARLYDPTLGRFLSRDTFLGVASAPQSHNPYAYAQDNPLRYTDPSGHFVNWANGFSSDLFQFADGNLHLLLELLTFLGGPGSGNCDLHVALATCDTAILGSPASMEPEFDPTRTFDDPPVDVSGACLELQAEAGLYGGLGVCFVGGHIQFQFKAGGSTGIGGSLTISGVQAPNASSASQLSGVGAGFGGSTSFLGSLGGDVCLNQSNGQTIVCTSESVGIGFEVSPEFPAHLLKGMHSEASRLITTTSMTRSGTGLKVSMVVAEQGEASNERSGGASGLPTGCRPDRGCQFRMGRWKIPSGIGGKGAQKAAFRRSLRVDCQSRWLPRGMAAGGGGGRT